MPRPPSIDRSAVRRDLDQAILGLSVSEHGAFTGSARFGPSLLGPPGRLHGGLHAYTRLLSVWRALHGSLPARVRLELDLLCPLRLETACPFEGRWSDGALETVFDGQRGLWGRASAATAMPVDRLHRLRERASDDPLRAHFRAADTIPVRLGRSLFSMAAPTPADLDEGSLLNRFLTMSDAADAVWTCTALDLLAAVVQAMAWRRQVFTVRMDLTLTTRAIRGPVRLLGDVHTHPDPKVPLPGVEGMGAHQVSVCCADPSLHTVYAWGDITLYPTRHPLTWLPELPQ